jgi:hypothetical protein
MSVYRYLPMVAYLTWDELSLHLSVVACCVTTNPHPGTHVLECRRVVILVGDDQGHRHPDHVVAVLADVVLQGDEEAQGVVHLAVKGQQKGHVPCLPVH